MSVNGARKSESLYNNIHFTLWSLCQRGKRKDNRADSSTVARKWHLASVHDLGMVFGSEGLMYGTLNSYLFNAL